MHCERGESYFQRLFGHPLLHNFLYMDTRPPGRVQLYLTQKGENTIYQKIFSNNGPISLR